VPSLNAKWNLFAKYEGSILFAVNKTPPTLRRNQAATLTYKNMQRIDYSRATTRRHCATSRGMAAGLSHVLPREVLLNLFRHCSKQDLMTLAVVCSKWSSCALQVLISKVVITSSTQAAAFRSHWSAKHNSAMKPTGLTIDAGEELLPGDISCILQLTDLTFLKLPTGSNVLLQPISQYCINLETVDLSGSCITDSYLPHFLSCCCTLVNINLSFTRVSVNSLLSIVGICRDILVVKLDYAAPSSSSIIFPASSDPDYHRPLKSISLTGSGITDYQLRYVVLKCPSLECVKLDGCKSLTDDSVVSLCCYVNNLKSLSLNGVPQVSDTSMVALSSHSLLRHVGVEGTSVTQTGLRILRSKCSFLKGRVDSAFIDMDKSLSSDTFIDSDASRGNSKDALENCLQAITLHEYSEDEQLVDLIIDKVTPKPEEVSPTKTVRRSPKRLSMLPMPVSSKPVDLNPKRHSDYGMLMRRESNMSVGSTNSNASSTITQIPIPKRVSSIPIHNPDETKRTAYVTPISNRKSTTLPRRQKGDVNSQGFIRSGTSFPSIVDHYSSSPVVKSRVASSAKHAAPVVDPLSTRPSPKSHASSDDVSTNSTRRIKGSQTQAKRTSYTGSKQVGSRVQSSNECERLAPSVLFNRWK
jgi:F-box-like